MSLWDVAMAPVRAAGGAFHELDMAMQGKAPNSDQQKQLLADLRVVKATTPDNTPARVEALRQVTQKYGISMPPGLESYEQIPTAYERAQAKSAEARVQSQGTADPVKRATAVAKLMGSRPWTGEEGDVYDSSNPEHRVWMRSLEELGGDEGPTRPSGRDGRTEEPLSPAGSAIAGSLGSLIIQNPALGAAALSSIPVPTREMPRTPGAWNQWSARQSGQPQGQAPAPAERSAAQVSAGMPSPAVEQAPPRPGIFSRVAEHLGRMTPSGGVIPPRSGMSGRPGSALAGIPLPSPEQTDAALTQVEDAGAVTVRNAAKVQQSQSAPKDTLAGAARAVKAYKASPEYVELSRQTGRLLNETDLSGPMKELLMGQSSADQKRLLKLIHRHGEAAVLEALQKSQKPKGES